MNKDLLYTILEMIHESVDNHKLTIRPLMEAGGRSSHFMDLFICCSYFICFGQQYLSVKISQFLLATTPIVRVKRTNAKPSRRKLKHREMHQYDINNIGVVVTNIQSQVKEYVILYIILTNDIYGSEWLITMHV